jgi:hypothetical protein
MKILKRLIILCLIFSFFACSYTSRYRKVKEICTITEYEKFLSDYPNGKYSNEAKKELDKLYEEKAWENTKRTNTIYSYDNFIKLYPKSNHILDAKNKLIVLKDHLAWQEADIIGTINSYQVYISNFPNGLMKINALKMIKELEIIQPKWKITLEKNTPEVYRQFISDFKDSSYAVLAKNHLLELENIFWKQAEEKNNIKNFKKYLSNFPNGIHLVEAEKAIIDLEVEEIFKGKHHTLPPMSKISNGFKNEKINYIEVFNNTVYDLTVRYSGNFESKKIVVKPYKTKNITLVNGKYKIAASVNTTGVINYVGEDNLKGGSYGSEFYIETIRY